MEGLETFIQKIADEVLNELKLENDLRAGKPPAKAKKDAGGLIGVLMNTGSTVKDIDEACREAIRRRLDMICIPQWFVDHASETIASSPVKLATVIGLPGGLASTFAKYAEVNRAVAGGAEVVMIPVNMRLFAEGGADEAGNDLREAASAAKEKAEVFAIVEAGLLSDSKISEVVEMCVGCGVNNVLLSYITGGKPDPARIKAAKRHDVRVGIFGEISDPAMQNACKSADAEYFTIRAI